MSHDATPPRSALFVDFDNIYSGLREIDPRAAERFATSPQSWVEWMVLGLPGPEGQASAERQRSILIRRCYLNPERFQRHRADFTRAGFEVVDCPPLTRQGKTSTDIRMVMDILDTLRHETYFGEFIVLSSDADFTPVLLRLRAMNRRTLVLAVGPAARAYRSACEQVIDEVFFIEAGLGITTPEPMRAGAPAGAGNGDLLPRMAERLHAEAAARPGGELFAADIPMVYKRFPEFTSQSDWLGFFGLRPLTAHLVSLQPALRLVDEPDSVWKWKLVAGEAVESPAASAAAAPAEALDHASLRRQVAELVRELVTTSSRPLDLPAAANAVQQRLGSGLQRSGWADAGSFTALLRQLELPGVALEPPSAGHPGRLYDPERFKPQPSDDAFERDHPELSALSLRVSQVTGTPRLTPPDYRLLFQAVAAELRQSPFNLTQTSKAVRDRAAQAGAGVSRSDVVFILRGIQFSGYKLTGRPEAPRAEDLGVAFARNVLVLCREAQMDLSDEEQELTRAWIAGLPAPARQAPPATVAPGTAPGLPAAGEARRPPEPPPEAPPERSPE